MAPLVEVDPLAVELETETCSRCGGSGHYSYCQAHGTVCFKCSGKGKVYTRRAEAAIAYARKLRTVKASEVKVGWLAYEAPGPLGGYRPGWHRVTAVGIRENGGGSVNRETGEVTPFFCVDTKACGHSYGTGESEVQAVPDKARLAEIRALMLQYQATLNKKGEVSKRRRSA